MRLPGVTRRSDRVAARVMSAADRWLAVPLLPFSWAFCLSDQKDLIDADVLRWLSAFGADGNGQGLHSLLYAFKEFRSLAYWRLQCGNSSGALLGRVMRAVWRPTPGLLISTREIGPGLFVAHGHGTTLAAERIGSNCYVHQGVTIGWDYRSGRPPVIGDDVFIGAGAVILGAVTVGDNAKIGANAVVLSDVPAGATAVGAPHRVCSATAGDGPAPPADDRLGGASGSRIGLAPADDILEAPDAGAEELPLDGVVGQPQRLFVRSSRLGHPAYAPKEVSPGSREIGVPGELRLVRQSGESSEPGRRPPRQPDGDGSVERHDR